MNVEQKALENIRTLHKHLLQFTCRLVATDDEHDIIGVSSGFIIRRQNNYVLLAAGHALADKKWFLETDVALDETHEVVGIQIDGVYTLETIPLDSASVGQEIDFAFAVLPEEQLQHQMQSQPKLKDRRIDLTYYCGPLSEGPILETEPYSYASWNKVTYYRAFKSFVERDSTSEFMMRCTGTTGYDEYRFELARQHQGESYYQGASGSPIVDSSGKVVSMLLGGDPSQNALFGLQLPKYVAAVDAALQASSVG